MLLHTHFLLSLASLCSLLFQTFLCFYSLSHFIILLYLYFSSSLFFHIILITPIFFFNFIFPISLFFLLSVSFFVILSLPLSPHCPYILFIFLIIYNFYMIYFSSCQFISFTSSSPFFILTLFSFLFLLLLIKQHLSLILSFLYSFLSFTITIILNFGNISFLPDKCCSFFHISIFSMADITLNEISGQRLSSREKYKHCMTTGHQSPLLTNLISSLIHPHHKHFCKHISSSLLLA